MPDSSTVPNKNCVYRKGPCDWGRVSCHACMYSQLCGLRLLAGLTRPQSLTQRALNDGNVTAGVQNVLTKRLRAFPWSFAIYAIFVRDCGRVSLQAAVQGEQKKLMPFHIQISRKFHYVLFSWVTGNRS